MPEPPKLFISYSHKDKDVLEHLQTFLKPLVRDDQLDLWDDTRISTGQGWKKEIDNALTEASIAILLVSIHFLASDFIAYSELPPLLQAEKEGGLVVMPVILTHCLFSSMESLSQFQAANDPAHPLDSLSLSEQNRVWLGLAEDIKKILKSPPTRVPRPDNTQVKLWNVPFDKNPFFTGRENVIAGLRLALTDTKSVAISGLGGIGKTQTAVEYAYRFRDGYKAVFWVNSETEAEIRESFAEIVRHIGLKEADDRDQDLVISAARRWLAANDGWLLICDNADEINLVQPFFPAERRGHVLLTTRSQATGSVARILPVTEMLPDEGAALLLLRAKLDQPTEDDRKTAEILSSEMGGLPLALDQAGAYIEEAPSNLEEYLKLFKLRAAQLLERRGDSGSPDHESVRKTFALAIEKVRTLNPAAADLLTLCAFLAPSAIPEEIFTEGAQYLGRELEITAADPYEWRSAVSDAWRYSLGWARYQGSDSFYASPCTRCHPGRSRSGPQRYCNPSYQRC